MKTNILLPTQPRQRRQNGIVMLRKYQTSHQKMEEYSLSKPKTVRQGKLCCRRLSLIIRYPSSKARKKTTRMELQSNGVVLTPAHIKIDLQQHHSIVSLW